jgi:hypothetical protein
MTSRTATPALGMAHVRSHSQNHRSNQHCQQLFHIPITLSKFQIVARSEPLAAFFDATPLNLFDSTAAAKRYPLPA